MNLLKVADAVWINPNDVSRVEWASHAPVIIMTSQARVPATSFGVETGAVVPIAKINECMNTLANAIIKSSS